MCCTGWQPVLLRYFIAFYRITGALPCCQTTQQRCRIINTFAFEFDHRTGARVFVWSSAVGDDHLALWQLLEVRQYGSGRHQDRPFDVLVLICRL
jgi:hypothetical protein